MAAVGIRKFFNCSVCGGSDFKKVYNFGLFSHAQTASVCKRCGLVCLNPRRDENEYEEFFSKRYWGGSQPKVIADKEPDDFKDPRALKIFSDLQPFLGKDAKIIEVGCGAGRNLLAFKANGFNNLTGLEPSLDCCLKLQVYGLESINQSLTSYMLGAEPHEEEFDCVILSHVLAHLVEPEKALGMISRILKPDGTLYILTPDFYARGKPYPFINMYNISYFSKASLEMLLNNCGFIVEEYPESSGVELAVVARKSGKKLSAIRDNAAEYRRALSYLKRDRVEYARIKIKGAIRGVLGRLITVVFGRDAGEHIYMAIINRLLRLHILK